MARLLTGAVLCLFLSLTTIACGQVDRGASGFGASVPVASPVVPIATLDPDETPITFPPVTVSADEMAQKALDYTRGRVTIKSGQPQVVLTMPVIPPILQGLGLGIGNYSPACQRPMYLVVVKGDFDARDLIPSLRPSSFPVPAHFIGYVFDLAEGGVGVIATTVSPDGADFKPVLNDPSLPNPDLAHAPQVAGPPYVPCRDIRPIPGGSEPGTPASTP